MTRVKQFADDLGISKNQAQTLINKGRSRKDGGSQILENVMKPKKYKLGGSETNPKAPVAKVKKTKLKKIVKKKDPFIADTTESLDKEFSKSIAKANRKPDKGGGPVPRNRKTKRKIIKKYAGGGATDFGMLSVKAGIDNNPKPTQADRIAGATKKMRGGGMAIQGTGFKGIR